MTTTTNRKNGLLAVVLHRLVRRFGYVLLREAEISRMESDATGYYEVMHRNGISERNAGYFNGLADYASKKAAQLRDAALAPNASDQIRERKTL